MIGNLLVLHIQAETYSAVLRWRMQIQRIVHCFITSLFVVLEHIISHLDFKEPS